MAGETQAATDLLEAIAGYAVPAQEQRPVKLGTIDPNYSSGLARVRFDGESAVSGKGYAWLASYAPTAGDRVVLLPVGTSYLILGRVRTA